MSSLRMIGLVSVVFLFTTPACCWWWRTTRPEKMQSLASALTKLSAAVEAYVAEQEPPEEMDERELIARATEHDPGLRAPFDDYLLHVKYKDGHTVVLVCDKNGKERLLEDAGCTARSDEQAWNANLTEACAFGLSIREVCGE